MAQDIYYNAIIIAKTSRITLSRLYTFFPFIQLGKQPGGGLDQPLGCDL